jgi:hypothetical protein
MPRYKLINGERIQFTTNEEAQRDIEEQAYSDGAFNRAMEDLRKKRNKLLSDSDWQVTMAKEKGTSLSTAFKNWRQALRDATDGLDTVEKVNDYTFPTKP